MTSQPDEEHMIPPHFLIDVKKTYGYMEVSEELLMDEGVIPDTREHKPVPFRRRLQHTADDVRLWLACWAFRLIAGYPTRDEDLWD